MLLLSCSMFDENIEQALPAANAIELFHNFTLVHDDIMDDAVVRRGKTTLHEKYGVNTAILAGDIMMVLAYKQLAMSANFIEIFHVFNETAARVCEGQQMDMLFENRENVSVAEYLKMIELKTAVLLGCAMKVGAIIGGADEKSCNALYDFGKNLGISFQLKDDLLDTYSDDGFGKKIGGDIIQNKKTYLLIQALELAEHKDKEKLRFWMTEDTENVDDKVAAVKTIYDNVNVQERTASLAQQYYEKALGAVERLGINIERKNILTKLANSIINRTK